MEIVLYLLALVICEVFIYGFITRLDYYLKRIGCSGERKRAIFFKRKPKLEVDGKVCNIAYWLQGANCVYICVYLLIAVVESFIYKSAILFNINAISLSVCAGLSIIGWIAFLSLSPYGVISKKVKKYLEDNRERNVHFEKILSYYLDDEFSGVVQRTRTARKDMTFHVCFVGVDDENYVEICVNHLYSKVNVRFTENGYKQVLLIRNPMHEKIEERVFQKEYEEDFSLTRYIEEIKLEIERRSEPQKHIPFLKLRRWIRKHRK